MREAGLYAVPKRKREQSNPSEGLPETTNLLVPKPEIVAANQVWYSDITFIKTAEGWLYLAAVMDAYSKRIVGYAMADHLRTELVIQALRMGTRQRRISKVLIHHSDKGSQGGFKRSMQHCSEAMIADLRALLRASSSPGSCEVGY